VAVVQAVQEAPLVQVLLGRLALLTQMGSDKVAVVVGVQ